MDSINGTPKSDRIHIGIFGRRNAGKSSVINAITGQKLAIVSDIKGTTTDPVQKAMELLPLGPVVITDTPGLDDEGELGRLRIEKAYQVLRKTDIALLVALSGVPLSADEQALVTEFKNRGVPYIIAYNKSDLGKTTECGENEICVSAKTGENIYELKEMLAKTVPQQGHQTPLIADLVSPGDIVVLVVPIDSATPKGRLILPQQQVIRDLLENGAIAAVCQDSELKATLSGLAKPPRLVVTDSQAFKKVSRDTPSELMLTSFSILFARFKGDLPSLVKSVKVIDTLSDGDKILISEGCTHHRQCDDIGSVKIPRWLKEYTGKQLEFEFSSGGEFPQDLSRYRLAVHCGGCMLNEREMKYRIGLASEQGVPIINYGILIAYLNGILKRSLEPFPSISRLIDRD